MTKDAPPAPAQESHKDKNDSLSGISNAPQIGKEREESFISYQSGAHVDNKTDSVYPYSFFGRRTVIHF
ncbi:MAG: hypothetical protein SOX25_06105 [Eubacteriales bacterium]|nr:hypothetical protein [Eubacteriales bacterium]